MLGKAIIGVSDGKEWGLNMTVSLIEMVLRLVGATIFGGLVGYQREKAEKPAGLRTHVLVCLGSALVMQVSVYPFQGVSLADPTRIAAGVVIGIGFLGAGTIIRQGSIVRGLTTAASIWVTAAVGLAIGVGFYVPAFAATALIIIVLTIVKQVEMRIPHPYKIVAVTADDRPGQLGKIASELGEMGVDIKNIELECDEDSGLCEIKLGVNLPPNIGSSLVLEALSKIEGVSSTTWEM